MATPTNPRGHRPHPFRGSLTEGGTQTDRTDPHGARQRVGDRLGPRAQGGVSGCTRAAMPCAPPARSEGCASPPTGSVHFSLLPCSRAPDGPLGGTQRRVSRPLTPWGPSERTRPRHPPLAARSPPLSLRSGSCPQPLPTTCKGSQRDRGTLFTWRASPAQELSTSG